MAEANAFLPGYLARYRARFAVTPRSEESAYVPMARETDLDRLFCFKYQRRVAADNTISFGGRVLQIPPGPDRMSYTRVVVEVHERLDGSIAVLYQGRLLLHVPDLSAAPRQLRARDRHLPTSLGATPQPLPTAPVAETAPDSAPQPVSEVTHPKPAPDHPFRRSIRLSTHAY